MNYAAKAYARVAKETASPRELEAMLLLRAAAQLQAVDDNWKEKPRGLDQAILYNRRLWTVFLDALAHHENRLPKEMRENLQKIGMFVMGETFSLMTKPARKHLQSIISINRRLAAGLSGRS